VDDAAPSPGYAEAEVSTFSKGTGIPWQVGVQTFDRLGNLTSLPFDVLVVC
jgi:hypothetical protein